MARQADLRLRRGTASAWSSANPVLADGEPGYDTANATLKIGDGSTTWSGLPGIGASSARATATATTASLAPGAADTSTTITLAKGYRLYSIQTSRPARVRLYATAAAQSADAGRPRGVDPTVEGVIFDYATADAAAHLLSPLVDGASLESVPLAAIAMTVTNCDSATGTVTVTLIWEKTE